MVGSFPTPATIGMLMKMIFIDEFSVSHHDHFLARLIKYKENRMRNLPLKKGYEKHIVALGEDLYAVEHIRGEDYNVAVVVLQDGRYFVGTALLNPIDQRNKRLGHEIAVGRALDAAVTCPSPGSLWSGAGNPLVGRDLGNACRQIARECIPERAPWCAT